MKALKNIFGSNDPSKDPYGEFWNWFQKNEKKFHKVIQKHSNIERDFFNKISPELEKIKEGFFFQTGMFDADTAELVFTADGDPRNIAFIEELVEAAPSIKGWKFTALKPEMDINRIGIELEGIQFLEKNMHFYAQEYPEYPDEIAICVVHDEASSENEGIIQQGVYIFLDNYLGELSFINQIDHLQVIPKDHAEQELIPIAKLKDYLIWREKEFIEKYEGMRYDTENDEYFIMEGELPSNQLIVAVVNTNLLEWDRKASHPWIAVMILGFQNDHNGMPGAEDFESLGLIEEEMMIYLKDSEGALNIGRQTGEGIREIYFACKDFRKPSKVFYEFQKKYSHLFNIQYEIYKDKYWQSFERFRG